MLAKLALWVGISALAVAVVGNVGLWIQTMDFCQRSNKTRAAIVAYVDSQAKRSRQSLPANDFYRAHPLKAAEALTEIETQRLAVVEAAKQASC